MVNESARPKQSCSSIGTVSSSPSPRLKLIRSLFVLSRLSYTLLPSPLIHVTFFVVSLHPVQQIPSPSWEIEEDRMVFRSFRNYYAYRVESHGEMLGYGESVDRSAAKRRAEVDAALRFLDEDPQLREKWMKFRSLVCWRETSFGHSAGSPTELSGSSQHHHTLAALPDKSQHTFKTVPKPDELETKRVQELEQKSKDLAKELVSSQEATRMIEMERNGLRKECEELRAEVKQFREERGELRS